jgi:predicted glycoside hydrolase/deacetylase ChbG (UPF0249 family)
LARKSAADDIDVSGPRSSVEAPDVVPNRERIKDAVALSGKEHVLSVGLHFDGTDSAPSEELPSKDAATSSGKQRQLIHAAFLANRRSSAGR